MEFATNQLPENHIKNGNIIFYEGQTSMFQWSCPAEIVNVNEEARTFNVISLDDCKEQRQTYHFEFDCQPDSRKSMHIPSNEELLNWMRSVNMDFRSVGVRECFAEDATKTESFGFAVDLDIKNFGKAVTWLVERWCAKNNIAKNRFSAVGFGPDVFFNNADDAVLFNIAFSNGIDWTTLQ